MLDGTRCRRLRRSAARPGLRVPSVHRASAVEGGASRAPSLTRVAALAIFIGAWQVVVMTGWKPEYLIPSPFTVFDAILHGPGAFSHNAGITLVRAAIGFGAAIAVGVVLGSAAALLAPLRAPVRSITKGMATLPGHRVVPGGDDRDRPHHARDPPRRRHRRGAAHRRERHRRRRGDVRSPIAHGRGGAGQSTRAAAPRRGAWGAARRARRPSTGWGLCWAALLTGELLLTLASLGLGGQLIFERGLNDYVALYEVMVVIFIIGVLVDAAFGGATALLRARQRRAIRT